MLHFTTYIWLDKFFDLHEITKDIGKRRFIMVRFTAFRAADSPGHYFHGGLFAAWAAKTGNGCTG